MKKSIFANYIISFKADPNTKKSSKNKRKICEELTKHYNAYAVFQILNQLNHVINLPEYKDILDFVKINSSSSIKGEAISRILQIIENHHRNNI